MVSAVLYRGKIFSITWTLQTVSFFRMSLFLGFALDFFLKHCIQYKGKENEIWKWKGAGSLYIVIYLSDRYHESSIARIVNWLTFQSEDDYGALRVAGRWGTAVAGRGTGRGVALSELQSQSPLRPLSCQETASARCQGWPGHRWVGEELRMECNIKP